MKIFYDGTVLPCVLDVFLGISYTIQFYCMSVASSVILIGSCCGACCGLFLYSNYAAISHLCYELFFLPIGSSRVPENHYLLLYIFITDVLITWFYYHQCWFLGLAYCDIWLIGQYLFIFLSDLRIFALVFCTILWGVSHLILADLNQLPCKCSYIYIYFKIIFSNINRLYMVDIKLFAKGRRGWLIHLVRNIEDIGMSFRLEKCGQSMATKRDWSGPANRS